VPESAPFFYPSFLLPERFFLPLPVNKHGNMTPHQFNDIKGWFGDYIHRFHSDDPAFQRNIELKRNHSFKVWENAAELGRSVPLGNNDQLIMETAGLLHDIGRFEQFRRYGTFSDKKSVNHGALGVEVLREKDVLLELDQQEREEVYTAVGNHNRKQVPDGLGRREELFTRILRDADKLDIWRVVTGYYCDHGETNNTLQLDLPDEPRISRQNIDDLLNGRMADLGNLHTLNDFKLLQIGWVYDINLERSYQLLRERGYLDTIFASLPDTQEVRQVRDMVEGYMEGVLSG